MSFLFSCVFYLPLRKRKKFKSIHLSDNFLAKRLRLCKLWCVIRRSKIQSAVFFTFLKGRVKISFAITISLFFNLHKIYFNMKLVQYLITAPPNPLGKGALSNCKQIGGLYLTDVSESIVKPCKNDNNNSNTTTATFYCNTGLLVVALDKTLIFLTNQNFKILTKRSLRLLKCLPVSTVSLETKCKSCSPKCIPLLKIKISLVTKITDQFSVHSMSQITIQVENSLC